MNIQFENLPAPIQQEILRLLETDNFKGAKRLRDAYERHLKQSRSEEDDTDLTRTTVDTPETENRISLTVGVY